MGYYLAILTAFLAFPALPWLTFILLAMCAAYYLWDLYETKTAQVEHDAREQKKQKQQAERAARLLADEQYARTEFFKRFLRFSPHGYHDKGLALRKEIEARVVVPVIWEVNPERAPGWLIPSSLDRKKTVNVIRCFNENRQLIAIKSSISIESDAGVDEACVPQTNSINKSEEVITLQSGEEVCITTSSYHITGQLSNGDVDFSFGLFLGDTHH